MVDINFSSNLRRFRIARKISKSELARRIGVSDVTIHKWENGDTSPRMGKVELIAQILDVTTDDLLFGPETVQPTQPDEWFSEVFSNLISQSKYSKKELAKELNVSESTIERWKTGDLSPTLPRVKEIAKFFEVNPLIFISEKFQNEVLESINNCIDKQKCIQIPLYGTIPAGEPLEMLEAVDHIEVPLSIASKYPKAFFLKVSGESMNKVIHSGTYALINPCLEVGNGDICAVVVNGYSATLKRFYKLHNSIVLEPDSFNPNYSSKIYELNKEDSVIINIIGKMVWFMPPLNTKY